MKDNKNFLNYINKRHKDKGKIGNDAEQEEQNLLMTTILEKSPIGFAVNTMDDGNAIFVSDKFEEIYGVEKGSIQDTNSFFEKVYIDPAYREEMKKKVFDDISTGDISKMKWNDVHITTVSGDNKVVSAMNIPVMEQNLMVSIVQDITEKSELQEELKRANKIMETKLYEMEKMNSLMVGRELKMIEMKKKIEELEKKISDK